MKKVFISVLCLIVLAALYACSNSGSGDVNTDPGSPDGGQGITVNDIPFERVTIDELPGDIKDNVEQNRESEGFDILQSGEVSYLVVYAGERPTAGHSIEITRIVDQEGVTQVTVSEKAPGREDIVAQVITYPLDIAKLELGISANVKLSFIKDDNG
jgi:hypothetical protein